LADRGRADIDPVPAHVLVLHGAARIPQTVAGGAGGGAEIDIPVGAFQEGVAVDGEGGQGRGGAYSEQAGLGYVDG